MGRREWGGSSRVESRRQGMVHGQEGVGSSRVESRRITICGYEVAGHSRLQSIRPWYGA